MVLDFGSRSSGIYKGAREPARILGFAQRRLREMAPAVAVPPFGDERSPLFEHRQQVRLWRRVANLGPSDRASALVLRMDNVARRARLRAGGDTFMNRQGAENVWDILR